jgi:hypothetical protein
MTRFIGFSGKKQRGKNLSANIATELLESRGYTVAEYAFAETLKDMCINVFGLDPNKVYGANQDKESLTHIPWDGLPMEIRLKYSNTQRLPGIPGLPGDKEDLSVARTGLMTHRELLQVMGTDIFREQVYSEVWAEAPFRQDWEGIDLVLVTDTRFPNEVEAIESREGVVVRVERDMETLKSDSHPSETALDEHPFRYVIHNNSTIQDLEKKVELFLENSGFIS